MSTNTAEKSSETSRLAQWMPILSWLQGKGIDVYLADVHGPLREQSRETGLLEEIGEDHVSATLDLAVKTAEAALSTPPAEGAPAA